MRVPLDTHVLLWFLGEPQKLSSSTRAALVDPSTDVLFSVASIWEIAIKASLNRADFGVHPTEIASAAVRVGFTEVPIRSNAAALVAQAMSEPAWLLTSDAQLRAYSELVTLVG